MPHHRPTLSDGLARAVVDVLPTGGEVRLRLDSASGLSVGQLVRDQSTDRTLMVRAIDSNIVTLDPQIPLASGSVLIGSPTIRARSASDRPIPMRHRPDWSGPWQWNFVEHV